MIEKNNNSYRPSLGTLFKTGIGAGIGAGSSILYYRTQEYLNSLKEEGRQEGREEVKAIEQVAERTSLENQLIQELIRNKQECESFIKALIIVLYGVAILSIL